jgi:amidase
MTGTGLEYWSLRRLSEALRRRQISAVEATGAMLDRIAAIDGACQSYVTVTADRALDQARRADAEIARDQWRGPLHGVPIAIKDLCFTTYAPTTAGMSIHKNWVPPYDSTVGRRLDRAGAVTLGKLKLTEGAGGTHHPSVVPPRNPWNAEYWPGASSSGSGVATTAGLCFGSLGSDTGGSIRFPSAACGLTGIKPTWGRVSRHGVFTLADSLDHVGPMARSAADAAAILGVIAGADDDDPTTLHAPVPDYLAELGGNIRGLRIGVDRAYSCEGCDADVVAAFEEAAKALTELGADIRPVQFPSVDQILAVSIPVMGAEAAEAHRETYPTRSSEYASLAGIIETGLKATPVMLTEAARLRREFSGRVARLWCDIDLLLVPAIPITTPKAEEMEGFNINPTMPGRLMRFTFPFDMTGGPTISLPCGTTANGLPLGVQLAGPHLSEALLCRAGYAFQQATDWHTRHPAV